MSVLKIDSLLRIWVLMYENIHFKQVTGDDSDENGEDRTSLIEPDNELNGRRSFMYENLILMVLNIVVYLVKLFFFFHRHFTREALPRLDNYRDILSVQAVYRPTLDDLHNATMSNKVRKNVHLKYS